MDTHHDDQLALFHRAIVDRDDDAWFALYDYCKPYLLNCLPKSSTHLSMRPEVVAQLAFSKFAQAMTPAKCAHFPFTAMFMAYLKRCVQAVVCDDLRMQQTYALHEVSLELLQEQKQEEQVSDPHDLFEHIHSSLDEQHLWQVIRHMVVREDERLLVWLLFVVGMKPAELQTRYPHLFVSVESVYSAKRNVKERLQRSKRLRNLAKEVEII